MSLTRSQDDVLERRSYLIDDLADRLMISRRTLERLMKKKKVEIIRVGRSVRIPRSEAGKILRSSADNDAN